MSTTSSAPSKKDILKEDALANVELLFNYWKLDFIKVSDFEYDFLNPTRIDHNFGAVRFNAEKGIGADFSNTGFSEADFKSFGANFDRSDFGFSANKSVAYGFDIVGLCQRLHSLSSYKDALKQLQKDLKEVRKNPNYIKSSLDAAIKRREENKQRVKSRVDYASTTLKYCRHYKDTLAETYFSYRGIILEDDEPSIRFHNAIMCSETKTPMPAVIFKIQDKPDGEIKGIHRIYIRKDGKGKADLSNPKMALGDLRGNGIWFGKPHERLYIAEGPENALTLRVCGAEFVVCAVSAVNMHTLTIPSYVKEIVICPDPDEAGQKAAVKCRMYYSNYKTTTVYPTVKKLSSGKLADLNDILMGVE